MTATTIAASYERVSTRNQGRYGFSLGAQHQSLDDFTRVQGWLLPEHLRFRDGEDEDASGADWDLPDLNRMLTAARGKEFDVLVVPDFDRFARSLVKGLVLEEQLKKYGVRVVYQRVPVEDTPEGRLLKNQLFSFAEYEREKFALRSLMGRRQKARSGMVVGGGDPPYGYRFTRELLDNGKLRVRGLEFDPVTEPVARRILQSLLRFSSADIADELSAEGIPGPRGGNWNPRAIWSMAHDPVYAGTWVFGKRRRRVTPDDEVGIGVPVPAIVSRQQWDDIQAALARRRYVKRGRYPQGEDPYMLRGMLVCGRCRGGLQCAPNGGIRYYRCGCHMPVQARIYGKPVCDLPDVHAADLEAELWRILNDTLLDPDRLAAGLAMARAEYDRSNGVRRDRLAALDTEANRQRQRLQAMVDELIDAGPVSKEAIRRRMADTETLIARLDAERAELAAIRAEGLSADEATEIERFAAEVRQGLGNATPADRRQLYETLRIRGTAYADPEGIRLGRKYRFRIDWEGAIQLLDTNRRAPYHLVE
jgi:site-specific DNA recombinase